jgi:hypothetical protein
MRLRTKPGVSVPVQTPQPEADGGAFGRRPHLRLPPNRQANPGIYAKSAENRPGPPATRAGERKPRRPPIARCRRSSGERPTKLPEKHEIAITNIATYVYYKRARGRFDYEQLSAEPLVPKPHGQEILQSVSRLSAEFSRVWQVETPAKHPPQSCVPICCPAVEYALPLR